VGVHHNNLDCHTAILDYTKMAIPFTYLGILIEGNHTNIPSYKILVRDYNT